jgi:hypothetical protein
MTEVETNRLCGNDTFKDKNTLQLQIIEESNLRGIHTFTDRSDYTNLAVVGVAFYIHATWKSSVGWRVHTAICRDDDDITKIPDKFHDLTAKNVTAKNVTDKKKKTLRSPFTAKIIVPIRSEEHLKGIQYKVHCHNSYGGGSVRVTLWNMHLRKASKGRIPMSAHGGGCEIIQN